VLSQHFAAGLADRYGRHITIGRAATEILLRYAFPGNVRELQNMLEGVAALSQADPHIVTDREIKPLMMRDNAPAASEQPLSLDEMESVAIERSLRLCHGNRTRAAALLGISRDTLYRKMRDLKTNGRESSS
ncbi:MAG: helix-turn-helix domain-containing protein, partial [Terriglobales bacterium]